MKLILSNLDRKKIIVIAVFCFAFVLIATKVFAALTLNATTITSDGALTLTPATDVVISNGNLGIGTVAATQRFTLGDTQSRIGTDTIDGSDNKQLQLSGAAASATRGAYIDLNGNEFAGTPGNLDLIPGLVTGSKLVLVQNAVNVLTSESNSALVNTLYLKQGNVGIGTTTPVHKLQLYESAASTANHIIIANAGSGSTDSDGFELSITSTGLDALVWNAEVGNLRFATSNAEKMRITSAGNVGIGTTPNANAILDVVSTTKAFMPPRMTTTERNAIASPTAGMVIYNTTTNKLNVYTTVWEAVTSS